MDQALVEISENSIHINHLEVPVKEVADFFRSIPSAEHGFTLMKAIEVGVFCLERGRTAQDTDFVKRKMAELLSQVEQAVVDIPARTEKNLLRQIGADDGQVLSPVKKLVNEASSETARRINDLKTLLSEDLDPKSSKSVLGAALQTLRDLLNPKNTDSIQNALDQAVTKATAENGVLAKAVKVQVEDALKPLLSEVDGLAKEIRGQEAATEALEQTTLKGISFEEEVTETLRVWAQTVGAEVDHVGGDNQPGDVLVTLRGNDIVPEPMSIVIEARDRCSRAMGRKAISADMATKIAQRNANAGIYVSRTLDGLSAREIGEWAEGACDYGPWVACTLQHLTTAVRFLIVQRRLASLRAVAPEVDSASIEQQVKAIRTALGRIRTIKTKLTELGGCADVIDEQAAQLREEIKEALACIEESIRSARKEKPTVVGDPRSCGPLTHRDRAAF
jgi:hypothetical protein